MIPLPGGAAKAPGKWNAAKRSHYSRERKREYLGKFGQYSGAYPRLTQTLQVIAARRGCRFLGDCCCVTSVHEICALTLLARAPRYAWLCGRRNPDEEARCRRTMSKSAVGCRLSLRLRRALN